MDANSCATKRVFLLLNPNSYPRQNTELNHDQRKAGRRPTLVPVLAPTPLQASARTFRIEVLPTGSTRRRFRFRPLSLGATSSAIRFAALAFGISIYRPRRSSDSPRPAASNCAPNSLTRSTTRNAAFPPPQSASVARARLPLRNAPTARSNSRCVTRSNGSSSAMQDGASRSQAALPPSVWARRQLYFP